ncbi:PREDICTED: uncharacterized protein LOC106744562 [Dinoponera quadriceps]|uniref:Uncharacterized protein LOC106744562 n=1 Tax=Dinoponera quadriceps TaxID=609295 RepID=A0A6P3X9K4_DINQU|nr:PREDICTED: uncharacterized protein LOC106744562 [Dinoponera quadriceps]
MEESDNLPKKPKRNFVEAWLSDERYKDWLRKVPSDGSLYYCTICKRNFSCSASHICRHASTSLHRKSLKRHNNDSDVSSDDDMTQNGKSSKSVFKSEWLEIPSFKLWLRDVPHNNHLCTCVICEKTFAAHFSHIRRHSVSGRHVNLCKRKGMKVNNSNDDFKVQDKQSLLLFRERKKTAEMQYAAIIAERNIPYQTAQDILSFFQQLGQDPNVLKSMSMGRTKCKNIISNVLGPVESEHVVDKLRKAKFSVFIEDTYYCNENWMTFFVRYIDPHTLDVGSQLVKLINIDVNGSRSENLFHAFKCEMEKLQIPFSNIVALSCDSTPEMTGKHSFKTKLGQICKHLLIFPCPCHLTTLVTHTACAKIPSFCDHFLKRIVNYFNNSKHSKTFQFRDCFQEKYRKILKLSKTRWLSHYPYVEKLLESWNTIQHSLQEMASSDETKCAEYLLAMMNNVELKAYFFFLKYILCFFDAFNTFFQSVETRVHLLQSKSINLLYEVCQNFVKEEHLENLTTIVKFSNREIQKDVNEVYLGSECEEYLNKLMMEDHVDVVTTVRQNCLQFYLTAAKEIREKLPIVDDILAKLHIFESSTALFDSDRETSFRHVSFFAKTFGDSDEESLRKEWFALTTDFTIKEKLNMSNLSFDDMWKEILHRPAQSCTYKYPNLRNILSAIRALPNSNADRENTFSILTNLKSKKRNKLSSVCVNATCVLKSALKMRGESAINMEITSQHLSRMLSDKLYPECPKKENPLTDTNTFTDEITEVTNEVDPLEGC